MKPHAYLPGSRWRTWLALMFCLIPSLAGASEPQLRVGIPLTEALLLLEREGLDLVFSNQVVTPDLKVLALPRARAPRAKLDELLRPHGLAAVEGPGGVLIVVARGTDGPSETPLKPDAMMILEDEIVVQPSRISLLGEDSPGPMSLSRSEIDELPHLGDDIFRTLNLLPGTASGDISVELHIRGGRRDETLVMLDGQELYEPYHLRDFDNAMSIIGVSALARVQLITAAFPVSYGDRMAGVLDMTTISPPTDRKISIAAGILGAQLDAADTHNEGRLGWITSFRRGSTDLIGRAFDLEDPRFWDLFGKVHFEVTPQDSLRAHFLMSRDSLDFAEPEENAEFDTEYDSFYGWLTLQSVLSSRAYSQTTLSTSRAQQRRSGREEDEERAFEVQDDRRLGVLGLVQSWSFQPADHNLLSAGLGYQKFDVVYDYDNFHEFFFPGTEDRSGTFALDDRFDSEHLSFYASDRFRLLETVTVEAGVRYDKQTAVDDDTVSPRLSAAWSPRPADVVRVAWGRFSQSHRAYELMVEDGDPTFYPAEKSEHRVVGFEHRFASTSLIPIQSVRTEAYQRKVGNPRPRYESLFETYDPFPEGQLWRVRLEPEESTAQGIELLVRGRDRSRWNWWINYALAQTTDRIEGRDVSRRVDQTHSLNLDISFRPSRYWRVNLAGLYHTGWPVTPVRLDASDESTPIFGDLNDARLNDYHRLDLRISRDWQRRRGTLSVYFDAQNLSGRRNEAGLDVGLNPDTDEIEIRKDRWPGFIASAGFVWKFERISASGDGR